MWHKYKIQYNDKENSNTNHIIRSAISRLTAFTFDGLQYLIIQFEYNFFSTSFEQNQE